ELHWSPPDEAGAKGTRRSMEASPCRMGCAIITDDVTVAIGSRAQLRVSGWGNLVRGHDVEQIVV
ncbi:MAG: hypothetical protein K0S14_127, partial [Thermomicrobiales bacterium]|nr:hypothetical protein [Thermomicrobiales bacterium]